MTAKLCALNKISTSMDFHFLSFFSNNTKILAVAILVQNLFTYL